MSEAPASISRRYIIDRRVGEKLAVVGGGGHRRKSTVDDGQLLGVEVRDRGDPRATRLREVADQIRPPVPVADDSDVDNSVHSPVAVVVVQASVARP